MLPLADALKPVIDWAKTNLGIDVLLVKSPDKHYWHGDGKLWLGEREDLICHELGHYCVVPPDRRILPDYGLCFYSTKKLGKIIEDGLSNRHTMEDGRAGVYGYYLYKHLKNSLQGKNIGWVDEMFHNNPSLNRSHKLIAAETWLLDNNLLDSNYIPTGKIFNGCWELDEPDKIFAVK